MAVAVLLQINVEFSTKSLAVRTYVQREKRFFHMIRAREGGAGGRQLAQFTRAFVSHGRDG